MLRQALDVALVGNESGPSGEPDGLDESQLLSSLGGAAGTLLGVPVTLGYSATQDQPRVLPLLGVAAGSGAAAKTDRSVICLACMPTVTIEEAALHPAAA